MKTTIVCGLLGSGKTTFIRNFLKNTEEKAVVLVNDFGQIGIDGEIFSAGGIEAVELPSGCVCCTLRADLAATVRKIVQELSPGHLMIEPSGVAAPSAVLEALAAAGISSTSVIGVVDAVELAELYETEVYGSFFQDQIENSDVVLVNKTDLADEAAVVSAERLIAAVNPFAVSLRTVNAVVDVPLPDAPSERLIRFGDCTIHFETLSVGIPGRPALDDFTIFFEDLTKGRYGFVARAKALVDTSAGPYRFDSTYGKVDKARFEKDIPHSRIVAIGEGLDREGMEKALPLPYDNDKGVLQFGRALRRRLHRKHARIQAGDDKHE